MPSVHLTLQSANCDSKVSCRVVLDFYTLHSGINWDHLGNSMTCMCCIQYAPEIRSDVLLFLRFKRGWRTGLPECARPRLVYPRGRWRPRDRAVRARLDPLRTAHHRTHVSYNYSRRLGGSSLNAGHLRRPFFTDRIPQFNPPGAFQSMEFLLGIRNSP